VVLAHQDREQVLADYARVRKLESRVFIASAGPCPPGREIASQPRGTGRAENADAVQGEK